MLGQEELQQELLESTHKTLIINGNEGSGKTLIVKWLARQKMQTYYEVTAAKVDDVREVVMHSNSSPIPVIYYFKEGDKMTVQAQNALLKVSEEPPSNATIIIGVENIGYLLPTIKSRSITYNMRPYKKKSMEEIAKQLKDDGVAVPDWAIDVAKTPGDLIEMADKDNNMETLLSTAGTVVESIGKASLQNVLTISNKVPAGKELQFTYLLLHKYGENKHKIDLQYMNAAVERILFYRKQMNKTNANKKNVLDMLMYDIWREYNKWNKVN